MAKKKSKSDLQHVVVTAIKAYREEADMAVNERMEKDKDNWDCFHLRQDYSKKLKGQSQEFLPKVAMAVEQSANFLQQGLMDTNEWFKVEPESGVKEESMLLKPDEVRKLLLRGLKHADFSQAMNDGIKTGLLASLMIHKVYVKCIPKVTYKAKEMINKGTGKYESKLQKKTEYKYILQVSPVNPSNYRVDPTGQGLYELEDVYIDYHKLVKMAEEDESYDMQVIKDMSVGKLDSSNDAKMDQARAQGLQPSSSSRRRTVKVTELWGNILDEEGNMLYENCMCAIADDTWLIRPPQKNPLWHGESPYVATPIITVPFSKQGKALMDAPVSLNRAQNEMFNLMLDGGMMSVHGIKQIRKSWLDDETQVEEGIPAGTTLSINNAAPVGAQVLERIDTATIPTDGINIFNILSQEQNVASMTNDLRMGVASFRQVKATEVVEASQTISSMFSGLAAQIESNHIEKILHKGWKTMLQNFDDLDENELKAILGDARYGVIQGHSKQKLFAAVQGTVFKVFGISANLNKQKDFTKLQALLQTIVTQPALMEEFMRKYSFTKLLTEIMRSLDLNPDKIEADIVEGGEITPQAQAEMPGGGMNMPNAQSQIPQAGAAGNQGDMNPMSSAVPQTEFPASRATPQG